MIGWMYNDIHISSLKVISQSINRPALPALRIREIEALGRHGLYDFGSNTYGKRYIEVEIKYVGDTFEELRARARDIAAWLSGINGLKRLVFDDEPDKYYLAKLYDSVPIQNSYRIVTGAKILFECNPPFALSINQDTVIEDITGSGQLYSIDVSGTIETPQLVTITNFGDEITTFTLTQETLKT